MKRFIALLPIAAVLSTALLLSGCSTASGSSNPDPFDLTNSKLVSALCGAKAQSVDAFVHTASAAPVGSGKRNALKAWGVDPKDDKSIKAIQSTLDERAKVTCETTSMPTPTPSESLDDANAKVTVTVGNGWSWDYPDRYSDLVKASFGAESVKKVNGDTIPKIGTCSQDVTVKLWLDAICGPLPKPTHDAVVARVLVDADYAYMVCNGLYNTVFHTPLGDISFAENNPRLKEIGCDNTTTINDWAGALVNDHSKAGELVAAKKLAYIAEFVDLLHVTTTGDGTPAWSYHLLVDNSSGSVTYVNPDAPENTVPEFELDPLSYTGQFLFMDITLKGVPNDCDSVGFNIGYNGVVNGKGQGGDGRFARFLCPPPAPPTTSCSNCGSTKPSCTVANGCICPNPNADGQCIPAKDKSIKQPIPSDKPTATPQPVQPSAPPVAPNPPVVVVPQKDQGGSNDGHVSG